MTEHCHWVVYSSSFYLYVYALILVSSKSSVVANMARPHVYATKTRLFL